MAESDEREGWLRAPAGRDKQWAQAYGIRTSTELQRIAIARAPPRATCPFEAICPRQFSGGIIGLCYIEAGFFQSQQLGSLLTANRGRRHCHGGYAISASRGHDIIGVVAISFWMLFRTRFAFPKKA